MGFLAGPRLPRRMMIAPYAPWLAEPLGQPSNAGPNTDKRVLIVEVGPVLGDYLGWFPNTGPNADTRMLVDEYCSLRVRINMAQQACLTWVPYLHATSNYVQLAGMHIPYGQTSCSGKPSHTWATGQVPDSQS